MEQVQQVQQPQQTKPYDSSQTQQVSLMKSQQSDILK